MILCNKYAGIIMKHYYGVDEGTIQMEMSRVFGSHDLNVS